MPPSNVLLLLYGDVDPAVLRREVDRVAGQDANVHVVAPPEVSRVRWVANDDDEQREEAVERAEAAANAVAGVAESERMGPAEDDPMLAIEDALRVFPADRIIVITRPEDEANWLERNLFEEDLSGFGLPVTHLELGA